MKTASAYCLIGLATILAGSISHTTLTRNQQRLHAVLKTKQKNFRAGAPIVLDFEISKAVPLQLFLHTSYGSTLLDSQTGSFALPDFITHKKGLVSYRLVYNQQWIAQGEIRIRANSESPKMLESYIGPPSCIAGGDDHIMQVVIASDSFDNPLPDHTPVQMKQQFREFEKEQTLYSKNLIAWTPVYSYKTTGRILISAAVEKTASKEFAVEVIPSIPVDFGIKSLRKHHYADGHQITEFYTTLIKDRYDNTVSNGTLVNFGIQNSEGTRLQTQATVINGIAKAQILHPDHADTWKVKAHIPGMAESNVLTLVYYSVIDDFEFHFDSKKREIQVGPLLSFMGQLIPDGTAVVLKVYQEEERLIHKKIKKSYHGKVHFGFNRENFPTGSYEVQLEALGIQKQPYTLFLE